MRIVTFRPGEREKGRGGGNALWTAHKFRKTKENDGGTTRRTFRWTPRWFSTTRSSTRLIFSCVRHAAPTRSNVVCSNVAQVHYGVHNKVAMSVCGCAQLSTQEAER